jgi:hypothetical protein
MSCVFETQKSCDDLSLTRDFVQFESSPEAICGPDRVNNNSPLSFRVSFESSSSLTVNVVVR